MTRVCICQICNCGRHHCPHKTPTVTNKGGPCALSEYSNKYRKHPIVPNKSCKPEPQPHEDNGPIDDKTTHRMDYIKHPHLQPYVHQGDQYVEPEGNMDMTTNYTKDFIKRPIDRAKPMKKEHTRKTSGKFEGEPTYKNDYRKWSLGPREKVVHDSGYSPPDAPFEGHSHYRQDYIPHAAAIRQSMKPAETARGSGDPFQDKTGYRDNYIKHPLPKKEVKEREEYSPNKAPLDGLSNYKKDYIAKQGDKTGSCKPEAGAYQSNAPFQDDTTNRVDYRKWAADRPFVHEPDRYVQPEGDMFMDTTTHTDYTKKPMNRAEAKRPPSRRKTPGKFNDATHYREDFRKWPLGGRPQAMMKPDYEAPDAPFEGESHYHRDYITHRAPPRQSMKPSERAQVSNEPFPENTGYRDNYTKHPLPRKEVREKEEYSPNKAPLDGMSNYRKDFIPKNAAPSSSCKPEANAYQSDVPFQDDTTQRVDYQPWKTGRPFVHEPDRYVQPEGDMFMNTTTHTDYTKKPIQKQEAKRPSSNKRVPGKFDGATNYNEDFRKWPSDGRQKATMKADYSPPEAPFEGSSHYRTDYHQHNQAPPKSKKPEERGVLSDAPFDDDTEYRKEYIKRKMLPCPAAVVENPGSKFVFQDQDPMGHKWYAPVSVSIAELPRGKVGSPAVQKQITALSVA